jgi:glycosyltransferase involved in cell wall biosynthesis
MESLAKSNLPENCEIIITDDGSSETPLLRYYKELPNLLPCTIKLMPHRGLPEGKIGWYKEALKNDTSDYFFITDADFIYSKNWMQALIALYDRLLKDSQKPALVTGFDTHANNHQPFEYKDYYGLKTSVGGANLLVVREFYNTYTFGELKCRGSRKEWEWDWSMSDNAIRNGWIIANPLKSIVSHVGHKGAWSKDGHWDKANAFIGENKDALNELNL